jgi:hypothetical protein
VTWTLSVISRDVEYNLSDNQDYLLTGIDGIAAAPVTRITERGPMQHGESDLGFRLQPRKIALALMGRGGDDAAWFARRNTLMSIFRSSDSPVKLKITNGDTVRQIDCYLNGTMEMTPEVGTAPGWQRVGIELYAPDPTWYNPAGESVAFALGGGGLLAIPLAVPMQVGASSIDQSIVVQYQGTWDAYPIITAVGPITSLLIQNNTLGDKLDFSGVTINAGDSYVIDCRYGYKTVTRTSDGANRIQDLTADSNLATFRVGAHPDVSGGTNSIRVQASGLTAASVVYLQYNTRYVGV